jgi:mannose-1-phosphate guanylyltransferase
LKAVILVGGQGMRLRPLTCTTPKPMLPLANIPFLEYVIRLLKSHGIEEIILSTSYLPEVFEKHFTQHKLGVNLKYIMEEEPLGTGGAVKHVEHLLDDTFIVFNGDILTDLNITQLIEYHEAKKSKATLTLTSVEDPTAYGLVPLDTTGHVLEFLEKPSWDEVTTDLVNAGTYVLEPEVLEYAPKGENYSFERGLFPALLEKGEPVFGFPSSAYWLDIGTPQKYLKAHRDILEGKIPLDIDGKEIKPRVWVGKGTQISPNATVFGPTIIGNNCKILDHASIFGHTTIGDNCEIREGVRLEGCVLYDGCIVDEASVIRDSVLGQELSLGKRVHVEETAVLGDRMRVQEENYLKKGIRIWPDTEIEAGTIRF